MFFYPKVKNLPCQNQENPEKASKRLSKLLTEPKQPVSMTFIFTQPKLSLSSQVNTP